MNVTTSSFDRFKRFVGRKEKKEKSSVISKIFCLPSLEKSNASDGLASFYDKIFEEKIEQRYEELDRERDPSTPRRTRRRSPSTSRNVGKLDMSRSVEFERDTGRSSVKLRRSNSMSKSPAISSRASFFQDAITSKVKGQS